MSNNENKLVPSLRFPEFISEKWEETTLIQVADYENGKAHEQDIADTGKYIVVNSKFISQDGEVKKFTNTAFLPAQKGDILMVLSDIPNGKAIAKCFLVEEDNRYTVNQRICRITPHNLNSKILYYLLNRNPYFLAFDDGVKQTNLRKEDVLYCPLLIPSNPKEQEKIAEILSSLDEGISAESEKLAALQDHKRGLLQNLLPQEGETVPKFRFKEFEDSGDWEEKSLGEIGEPLMCKRIFKEETTPNPKSGIPFYKIGTFGRVPDSYITKEIYEEYKSKYSFPKISDILISASGTIGRLVIYDGSPAFFQDSNIIWLGHNEEMVLNRFLFYCYTNLRWQTSDGGVISRLYNSDFKRMTIYFPKNKKEQKKVAETLSSIDEFIKAQSKKVEALILHKKGLLQGLFPQLSEL